MRKFKKEGVDEGKREGGMTGRVRGENVKWIEEIRGKGTEQ